MVNASVTMEVLPPSAFDRGDRSKSLSEEIAVIAYEWTSLNRDLISLAGLIDTVAGWIPDG